MTDNSTIPDAVDRDPLDLQQGREDADRAELTQTVRDALTDALTQTTLHGHERARWVDQLAPAVTAAVWDWLDPTTP